MNERFCSQNIIGSKCNTLCNPAPCDWCALRPQQHMCPVPVQRSNVHKANASTIAYAHQRSSVDVLIYDAHPSLRMHIWAALELGWYAVVPVHISHVLVSVPMHQRRWETLPNNLHSNSRNDQSQMTNLWIGIVTNLTQFSYWKQASFRNPILQLLNIWKFNFAWFCKIRCQRFSKLLVILGSSRFRTCFKYSIILESPDLHMEDHLGMTDVMNQQHDVSKMICTERWTRRQRLW